MLTTNKSGNRKTGTSRGYAYSTAAGMMEVSQVYGVPDSAEWSFLVGREVLQVCIGLHQVSLRFDDEVSMNIECAFDHATTEGLPPGSGLPQKAARLVSLLGSKVAYVSSEAGKTLIVRFTNKETLKIYDSNEVYESFQVIAPGREIIV